MKTLGRLQAGLVRVATVGLLMSAASCGSDASDKTSSPQRSSPLAQNDLSPRRARQNPPPPRPSTKEACDVCQGLWAVHGIEPDEVCICKANDEGHECIDGNDCQGECILDGDAEFKVMEPGDPPRGYYKGHCAAYDTTFGCYRRIADDIQGQLPLTPEEAGEDICVD
jgi:hypothetical protein